jgi:hypothetical protein
MAARVQAGWVSEEDLNPPPPPAEEAEAAPADAAPVA